MKLTFRDRTWIVDDEPNNADFWSWVSANRWETHTFNIFDRFLKSTHTYIDLGAWIGPTILYAAPMAKRSLAVEPDPVAFKILAQNVAANGLSVELCEEAITGHDGTLTLGSALLGASTTRANPHAGGNIGAWVPDQTCTVPCSTLRTFCAKHEVSSPMFVKMDVEGGEEDILKDFEFFATHKPTLYVSMHSFWWRDVDTCAQNIRKIAGLYRYTYNAVTLNEANLEHGLSYDFVFTDSNG